MWAGNSCMAWLSLRGGGWGFSPQLLSTWSPAVPSCLLPSLLVEFTRQLEILERALLRSPERWPEMETSTGIPVVL